MPATSCFKSAPNSSTANCWRFSRADSALVVHQRQAHPAGAALLAVEDAHLPALQVPRCIEQPDRPAALLALHEVPSTDRDAVHAPILVLVVDRREIDGRQHDAFDVVTA